MAMESIIKDGQSLGAFATDVDIPLLSTTLFGTINQALSTKHFFSIVYGLETLPPDAQDAYMVDKLRTHLKKLFRAMLTPELSSPVDS